MFRFATRCLSQPKAAAVGCAAIAAATAVMTTSASTSTSTPSTTIGGDETTSRCESKDTRLGGISVAVAVADGTSSQPISKRSAGRNGDDVSDTLVGGRPALCDQAGALVRNTRDGCCESQAQSQKMLAASWFSFSSSKPTQQAQPTPPSSSSSTEVLASPTKTSPTDATTKSTGTAMASLLPALSPNPPIRVFRPNRFLEIAFDVRTRNPLYVLEHLDVEQIDAPQPSRRPNFHEEKALPEVYRSRISHYRNSGYDRGHQAPAADFGETKDDHSFQVYDDTFTLCNVSPQHHAMNVSIWARLENWCRSVAKREAGQDNEGNHNRMNRRTAHASADASGTTYVMTGPLWLPTERVDDRKYKFGHLSLGQPPSLVHVPTHFFKVVVVVRNMKIHKHACFVIPNAALVDKTSQLEDFVVHWQDLEAVSGLQFFPILTMHESWKDGLIPITDDVMNQARRRRRKQLKSGSTGLQADSSSLPLLLVADGGTASSSMSRTKKSKKDKHAAMQSTIHLCSNGGCRSKS